MDELELLDALRSLPAPDSQAAQARAGQLVLAAHAGRPAPGRRRYPRRGATMAIALGTATVIAGGLGLTMTQSPAVARWVRDALRTSVGHSRRAALVGLPGGGRLLVSTGSDAWVAGQGLTRRVGHTFGGAVSWSAFGNYVACACRQSLDAVALNGRVAWSEHFDAAVGDPTWSADGNRIAFTVGRELYVTAGDGTGARGLRPTSGPLGFAAWRPGAGHELAVIDAPGRVSLIDTDTGRDLAHVTVGPDPLSLTWSSDGRRLLVATRLTLRVYDAGTRLVSRVRTPRGTSINAAELSPSGRQIASVVDDQGGREEAELASVGHPRSSRALLVGTTLSGGLLFSPDGRWLLVAWNELDSWMFFTTSPPTRVRQISHVTAHFGSAEPVATAWCCTPRPSTAPTG